MTTSPEWLKTAAKRSAREPSMLGHVFEQYLKLEGRSQEQLAAELGCSLEVLQWVSLCRRPHGEDFAEHVQVIAKRFEVELLRLVAVIRRVEVVKALSSPAEGTETAHGSPLQLAARDRSEDDGADS